MHTRAQYVADSMALSLASEINTADRIGEFNQLQEASRELIFISRQDFDHSSNARIPDLAALCSALVENARSGHSLIEKERQNQILSIRKEVQDAVVTYNHERNKNNSFAFFGLRTFEPDILRVDLGRIAKVISNVRDLEALPELAIFDQQKGYFNKSTKLYACDTSIKLPEPDSDLDFNFSSLPAYIGKTSAPARNTNTSVFVPYGTIFADGKITNTPLKQIPSAIQIHYDMNVIVPWEQSNTGHIQLVSTGSASGASADSQ